MEQILKGQLVDIIQKNIYPAAITIEAGRIRSVERLQDPAPEGLPYILPGFIDSHVHIESSMLVPSEFARLAVVHGTVATISDPHEIANVCGLEGVEYMINNGKTVPFKFYFGAPSCVPATTFESAGATLDAAQVEQLLNKPEINYLSEMMNFPGVLNADEEVMKKIASAKRLNKPVDGHAPGLMGDLASRYIEAGITTDHECFTKEEALDKLKFGMKIIIREGSAARNFGALADLLNDYPDHILFCSDDKHPDSLVEGHIDQLCARAVANGIDVFNVLKAACLNPVFHYNLSVGLLQPGDPADCILVEDLVNFKVLKTYIDGMLVAENGHTLLKSQDVEVINNFNCAERSPEDFQIAAGNGKQAVIEALDGQLITNKLMLELKTENGAWVSDVSRDILKIVVVNRYKDSPIAKAFIKNTGLKQGALASSVAHDSHNIVGVGVDDESLCKAVNLIIRHKGGVCCVKDNLEMVLPLPVAGLMSAEDGYRVAEMYSLADQAAKDAGSTLSSPFMTLSFMALLVIPHLKLSDKGLFDGDSFCFVNG
jgi:adenine deaminase